MPHIEINIHLIAFDRQVYKEINLIAVTLTISSKTRAPELKMIVRVSVGYVGSTLKAEQLLRTV